LFFLDFPIFCGIGPPVKRDHIRPPIHHHATSPQERTTPRRYLNCRGAVMAKQPKPQARPSHRAQPVENKGASRKPCWMHGQSDFRGPGSHFDPQRFGVLAFPRPKPRRSAIRSPATAIHLDFPGFGPFHSSRTLGPPSASPRTHISREQVGFRWISLDSPLATQARPHFRFLVPFAMSPRLTGTSWIWLDLPGFGLLHPSLPVEPRGSCHYSPSHLVTLIMNSPDQLGLPWI